MPDLRDFLSRFRPAGTPGAAARPGVPVDRVAEREAELQPVLALLADTEQQAARIRRAAAEQAQQRRETAHRQAEAILADARLREDAVRAEAAAQAASVAAAERAQIAAATKQRVARLRTRIDAQMPAYVERAVSQVLAVLAARSPGTMPDPADVVGPG
jgi:flagellar biosynthesis/type III secretory pathway protein FliH